ncbi:MAG: amino acid adenylation domain-containing protein, partial [Alphaproteobacteria bacterium]
LPEGLSRKRIALPPYPFQRKRFWVEPNVISAGSVALDAPIDAKAEVIEVAPASSDSTETRLKEVLSELSGLDVEELDSSASFLELGFDSLLLTQVGKEIRDVFGVAITLRQLIDEFQSLNDLIKHLDANALPDKISPMTGKDMDGATKTVVEGIELSEVSAPTTNISRSTGDGELTPRQKAHIENLIKRYNAKTPTSKQMTADYRRYHADPRTASGFNRLWKEIVYQIVTVKSKGSRLLDVDGNEYIDILNGFGPGFLGHSPEIVVNAVTDQLNKGFEVGPQSPAAMEAAKLFCEVTGNERTSFVCTGSEAVQAVMRLARTVTGRDKIVMFARDYHGNFDEVLVRGVNSNGTLKSLPMAPGIPKRAAGDMIVLPYGTDESLEIIRRLAPELAAVIVEPVQSRRPEFQPREFIREIRQITERSLTLFVFDEVVTGFRFGPRGAQEFYGVEADLVTYGKVVGGGMPVGVVSGKAEFMDTFDGGQWNYGDDSFPEKPVTFFAGTFVRHPLAMASVKAMLSYFKSQPSFFWKVINAKGDRLASAVDSYFREKKVPIRMVNCGSLMYVRVEDPKKYGHLLFAHLREKGVFILEDFPSYLTASHTDEDIDYLIRAFKESADELLSAGFFAEDADSAAIAPLAPALLSPPPVLTDPTRRAPDGPLDLAAISIPTTESQKEIWMATLINPAASTAYNESVTLWMKGVLDTAAIREAVKRTFQRHDALRSRFTPDGMEMLIGPDLEIEIPHVDLSGLDKVARKEKMAQILKDEVNIPFDHINGPYVRAQLVTQEKDSHALIITAHHIVCDGWSIDVIMHDVGAFYTALRQGTEPDLGPAQSIIDYARVERQWQLSHEFEESEKYWLDKFSGNVPTLDFPTDRPHPSLKTSNGARIDSLINAEVAKGLRAVCTREKCTFVNILFAAFNLYVYRLTGQHDMVIGMTSSGQSAREMEGVVGHCVNLLPIRSYIGNDMTLGGYLKSLRGAMLDAFDHQHYTYGTLIKNLKIHRDPSRVMLTPIVFNFDNGIDLSAMKFGGLETEFVANPRSQEHFEIFLSILDDRSKVGMEWSYNTDLFEDATIRQHIKGFHDLLAEIADSPDVTIDRLISGLDAKRPESGAPKINTYRDFPADLGVHQLFEKMAAETPDAIAVTLPASEKTAEETLSYGELNARANRLAHMLASKGIKAGDLVTLCVERNLNILVGMLGILKAGAAYVPLDPHFPPDRLSYMIADSKSKALVTEADILPNLGANGIANICLDRDAKDLAAQSDANPAAANMDADPLAYVIYTSGSTGKPKGVEVRHRGVVNFLTSMAETPGFTKDDRLLAVTTISFDIAVLELFLPLSVGGSLLLSRQEDTYDGDRLARLIEDHGITMLQATPATWRLLLDSGWQGNEQLTALCGGEALLQELGARLVHKCKALWNMYGPTETTIWSTVAKIDPDTIAIAIGQPIANTEVYILNADMRPVPRGVPGELYIGGEGLARGYLDQPEMTAERFVAHPFSDAKGARIYRTGDLARWLPSGDLECLGRVDRQVKVRGYRIELGEIESALEELDGIQQAAVIAREETPGDQRLIGYVVQEPGNVFSDSDILEKLGERLPKYMIPSVVAPIDEMPLTPNRKVNYRELPKVDLNLVARDETRPTTKLEEELVEIWRKVLNIDNIGVHADFFELGGHSLLAVRLFHQIRQKYSLDLPISTLFMNPTVQTLAEKLGEDLNRKSESEEEDWSTTTVIHPGGSGRPVFIVCGKGGNALELWALGQALGKNRPVIGLQTRGILGHTPRESIEEMAAEHIKYIRGHQESGPYHIAGYSGGGLTAFEIARQLQNRGEKVAFVGIIDTWAPGFHPSFESEPVQRLMYEISKLRKEGVGVFMNRLKAKIRNSGLSVRGTRLLTRLSPYRYRLRMLEADWLKSANRYQGGAYNGSITLFRSSPQTLYEEHIHEFKPTYGWEKFVEREIYEVQLVGNHLDILSDDVVENLAHAIERQIEIAEK